MSTTIKRPIHAAQLTMILIGVLAALILALVGGSFFAATQILQKSTAANHAEIDAEVSAGSPSRYLELKDYLAKNATGIAQTSALTAGLGLYDQNTIDAMINGYASKAGVTITSFNFGTGASAPTTPAAASSAGSVSLTLDSPVQYKNFIVFLRLLEQGLMPAQITSAQISADPTAPGTVDVSSLAIKVVQ